MQRYLIPITAAILVAISLVTLFSAVYYEQPLKQGSVFFRQFIWVIFGAAAFFLVSRVYYRNLLNIVYPFYALVFISLILVLIFGGARLGAQRWIKIWWFNFQPSEFAKLSVILVLSHYFSRKGLYDISLNAARLSFYRGFIIPFLIITPIFLLIFKQPDLGTALIILFIFFGMAYLSGVKARYLIAVIIAVILCSPLAWMGLKDYQRDRLMVFLNPNIDPLGAGYTIIQSKIAIGSGRLWGKGWLSGTQGQLNFLPESHTDFILGVYAEETGFLGCIFLIVLYYLIIHKAFAISTKIDDNFGRLFAFGIALMFGIQVYINISMTIGLSPVVGVPLPMISYGGSSMLLSFISLGILYNIDRRL